MTMRVNLESQSSAGAACFDRVIGCIGFLRRPCITGYLARSAGHVGLVSHSQAPGSLLQDGSEGQTQAPHSNGSPRMSLLDGRLYGDSEEVVSDAAASDLPLAMRSKMQLSTLGAFCFMN